MSKALHALLSVFPFVGLLAPGSVFGGHSILTGAINETTVRAVAATPQGDFLIATDKNLIRLSQEGKILERSPWQPPIDESVSIVDVGAGAKGEVIIVLSTRDGRPADTGLRTSSFKPLGSGRIYKSESDIELVVL